MRKRIWEPGEIARTDETAATHIFADKTTLTTQHHKFRHHTEQLTVILNNVKQIKPTTSLLAKQKVMLQEINFYQMAWVCWRRWRETRESVTGLNVWNGDDECYEKWMFSLWMVYAQTDGSVLKNWFTFLKHSERPFNFHCDFSMDCTCTEYIVEYFELLLKNDKSLLLSGIVKW